MRNPHPSGPLSAIPGVGGTGPGREIFGKLSFEHGFKIGCPDRGVKVRPLETEIRCTACMWNSVQDMLGLGWQQDRSLTVAALIDFAIVSTKPRA